MGWLTHTCAVASTVIGVPALRTQIDPALSPARMAIVRSVTTDPAAKSAGRNHAPAWATQSPF